MTFRLDRRDITYKMKIKLNALTQARRYLAQDAFSVSLIVKNFKSVITLIQKNINIMIASFRRISGQYATIVSETIFEKKKMILTERFCDGIFFIPASTSRIISNSLMIELVKIFLRTLYHS